MNILGWCVFIFKRLFQTIPLKLHVSVWPLLPLLQLSASVSKFRFRKASWPRSAAPVTVLRASSILVTRATCPSSSSSSSSSSSELSWPRESTSTESEERKKKQQLRHKGKKTLSRPSLTLVHRAHTAGRCRIILNKWPANNTEAYVFVLSDIFPSGLKPSKK